MTRKRKYFKFLMDKGIEKAKLLPYHNMGAHKYEGIGLSIYEFSTPSEEKMKKYKEMFRGI